MTIEPSASRPANVKPAAIGGEVPAGYCCLSSSAARAYHPAA